MDATTLSQTEVVLLALDSLALALAYSPGETPSIVAKVTGSEVSDLLWSAQEMGVPIVECAELNHGMVSHLEQGQDIPEPLFRTAAQAIALVQRSRPSPVPVRLVKSLERTPVGLPRRFKRRLSKSRTS